MMRVFRWQTSLIIASWVVVALMVGVDLAGVFLAYPPPTNPVSENNPVAVADAVNQATDETNNSGEGEEEEAEAEAEASLTNPKGKGGIVYAYTRQIPVVVNRLYFPFHFALFPLPPLFTFLFYRYVSGLKRKQRARIEEIARNSVTVLIGPPIEDTTKWQDSWAFLQSWHTILANLPQNEPRARWHGNGIHFSLGMVSRAGDGIRLTARIPSPTPPPLLPEDDDAHLNHLQSQS